jgi:hypothetical protein
VGVAVPEKKLPVAVQPAFVPVPLKVELLMSPAKPAAVLLVVSLPVRVEVVHLTSRVDDVNFVSPMFVALIKVLVAIADPVGCVRSGAAEAVEAMARAAKAAIAMQAAMSFFDM